MSYSTKVKQELSRVIPASRHCRLAELSSMISLLGKLEKDDKGESLLKISCDNATLIRKCFTLLRKTYNIIVDIIISKAVNASRKHIYSIIIHGNNMVSMVLESVKLTYNDEFEQKYLFMTNNMLIKNSCCKRSFIRGAFLSSGSVSDPEKAYHFEIVLPDMKMAVQIRDIITSLGPEVKIVTRKNSFIVYLKESEQIATMFGLMKASASLMDFENTRILKGMRNEVNRKVNCEAANINKTVSASIRQIRSIELIRDTIGFDRLPSGLRETACLRLEYPEANLKELGEYLSVPIGKSGVNHRLRKLSQIARDIEAGIK
jgi:hypothetical protein